LATLEAGGLRTTLINAVEVATNRSKELGEIMIKNFSNNCPVDPPA
jgi:pyrroline-5-carboxylate reductase